MIYMTLTDVHSSKIPALMNTKAGHMMPWGHITDAATKLSIPVVQFGKVRIGMFYTYGQEADAGTTLEGLDSLCSVGDVVFVVFMDEATFNSSSYLSFLDIDEAIKIAAYDKLQPILRTSVVVTPSGQRLHTVSMAFAMPDLAEVYKSPKSFAMEIALWTWKPFGYFAGYMEPALVGTPTLVALKYAHEAFITHACIYHTKHGQDHLLRPATQSFSDMLASLQKA